VQSSWGGEQFELPAGSEPRLRLKAWATEEATRRLLNASGQDLDRLLAAARSRDFTPVPLGIRTSIAFTNKLSRVQTANVGGVLSGSDPKLAAQVVVLSAHHDHFGIGEPDASGDRIYHGAVDNASGCAQVLAIARAFAALHQRPRRSVLALFVAGEERGLLGSSYYALHPSFPAGRIAANINIDGGNIFGRSRDATLISMGKSSLDAIAARSPSSRDAYSSPISSPTAATTTAPTSSPSRRSAYRHCFSRPARTSSAGRRLGAHADRGVGAEEIPSAGRQARRQLELRRHDSGRAARYAVRVAHHAGRWHADVEARR